MTVNFESIDKNQGKLTFEISQEQVKKGLDIAFKKVKNKVSVPGFRKGKVPRQIFNNVYGEAALYDEALNALLPEAFENAIKESGIEMVGQPQFDIESVEANKPWVLSAIVSTKPEVKLGEYKGLSAEKESTEVTKEEVEETIEQKRKALAELVVKESAAALGDTVIIDYEGFVDEVAFEGGKGSNHSLELGSNSFIPGFEDQLVGASQGDEVEVKVTFPEEYHAENLAGKDAIFKVKVHEVKSEELPELDDEFAKDVDEEVASLEELRNKIEVDLKEQKEARAKDAFDDAILKAAVNNAEIEGGIPKVMIDEEIHRQMDFFLNNLSRQGIKPELYYQITGTSEKDLHDQFEEEADLRTKTNLVLEAIVKAENIEISEEEMNKEIASLATQYNMEEAQVRNFVTDDMLSSDIKLKKAMSVIIDSAQEA